MRTLARNASLPGRLQRLGSSQQRGCPKNVWWPRPRSSSVVLGFLGNFEDEDEHEHDARAEFLIKFLAPPPTQPFLP